jgi:OmpA-OmpF porin, OOP family
MMKMMGNAGAGANIIEEKIIINKDSATGNTTTQTTTIKGTVNDAGDFVYNTGNTVAVTLPNNTTINVGDHSQLFNLLQALKANDDKLLDKTNWFTIENLQFESGKAILKAGSEETIKNIHTMLAAYPTVELKLGGYTDNSGDSTKNVQLSLQRAEAAKAAIVKLGTNAKRLSAEGYGPQFAVASNATAPGMAQNRRIDIRIIKK